jgi:hypothetical protein
MRNEQLTFDHDLGEIGSSTTRHMILPRASPLAVCLVSATCDLEIVRCDVERWIDQGIIVQ